MTHQSRTEVPYVQEMYSFDEIVKAMMSQLDDAKVQEIGLRTLWNLSCNHPDSQVEILKQGIDVVVKVMLNHLMTARVQWLGCGALCSFACNNAAVQVEIARKGGIEAVVNAISTHIDNEGVQELGCGALTSLACNNTTTQMSIVMLGCVDHVVNGMARHLNSESVQQQGCGALASLSSKNAVAQVEIAKKGGFEAVVSAMMSHPENARVQELGCGALANLAGNDQVLPWRIIFQHTHTHTHTPGSSSPPLSAPIAGVPPHPSLHSQPSANPSRMASAASSVAASIASSVSVASHAASKAEGVQTLVMQQQSVAATAAADEHPAQAHLNHSYNAIAAVVSALVKHHDNTRIQETGCGALLSLALHSASSRLEMKRAGAEQLVRRALASPSASNNTLQWGQRLLETLGAEAFAMPRAADAVPRTAENVKQDELLQRITRLEQEGEHLRAGIEGWQGVASRDRELLLRSNRLPLNKEGWYHERTPQEGKELRAGMANPQTSLPVPSPFTARAAVPIVGSPLSPSSRRSSTSALSPQQLRIAPEVEAKSATKERGVIVSPTFEDTVVGSDIIKNMCSENTG